MCEGRLRNEICCVKNRHGRNALLPFSIKMYSADLVVGLLLGSIIDFGIQ